MGRLTLGESTTEVTLRARWAGTTSTDRPQGLGIYRTHPYHVLGGAVPVWEPMLGLLGTATNPSRVEHDQGGKGVNTGECGA